MRRKLSRLISRSLKYHPIAHPIAHLTMMGLFSCPQVAWAFNSRRMDHAFFLMTLVCIFVASLIVILIALGALKYLEKSGRALKSQAQLVRALKLAPILIGAVMLILSLLGAEFWRQL